MPVAHRSASPEVETEGWTRPDRHVGEHEEPHDGELQRTLLHRIQLWCDVGRVPLDEIREDLAVDGFAASK